MSAETGTSKHIERRTDRLLWIALGSAVISAFIFAFLCLWTAKIYLNVHIAGGIPFPGEQIGSVARIRLGSMAVATLAAVTLICAMLALRQAGGRRATLAVVEIALGALSLPLLFLVYWVAWSCATTPPGPYSQ